MDLLVRILNFALFAAHTAAGILALLLCLDAFPDVESNTVFPIHYARQIWVDCKTRRHENITTLGADEADIRAWCDETSGSEKAMTYAENVWIDANFGWIVTAYFLWTGTAHLMYSTVLWGSFSETLRNRMSWKWRWVEYAVSSALMFFLILYFFGITDLVQLVGFSAVMGGIVLLPAIARGKPVYVLATFLYLFLWIYPTARIFVAYWDVLDYVPWFVWVIIAGEFALFGAFPVIYAGECKRIKAEKSLYVVEIMYGVFSALSKLLLGVVLGFFVFM
jgi:hypothetical protein